MSRTSRYASSFKSRNARSSENPRATACTTSRALRARTGSEAPASSIDTSPLAESTRIRVPVNCWRRLFVSPSGPISTPSRSAGIRANSMSASQALLQAGRSRVDPEPLEESGHVGHVAAEPLVRVRMIQGDGLAHIDDDHAVLPPKEVVLAQVRVDEPGLPDRLQVGDDIFVDGARVLKGDLTQRGSGSRLVPDILHHQDIVEDAFGIRHSDAGIAHPDEVLVLLLRPGKDRGLRPPLDPLEPRVPLDIQRDVPERGRRDAIDLERLAAPGGVRPVEDTGLLARADRIVQGGDDSVSDQGGERQERGMIEHLVIRLPRRGVLLLGAEGIDLPLEMLHASFVDHRRGNGRPRRLRALRASEDIDRLRDQAAAAHVARLGLRVPMLDVALVVLEFPDLDDEEVPFPDPHPLFQLARDPTEATLPVLAHDPHPRGPEELVRDSEDFLVFRPGHADADDLFFGHFRIDGEGIT